MFLAGLKHYVNANPGTPMSVLSWNHGVSTMTISNTIRKDLGYKSFTLRVRHLLTEAQKENRLVKCKHLLASLKSTGGHMCFFMRRSSLWTSPTTGWMTGGSAGSPPRLPWCSGARDYALSWSLGSSAPTVLWCHPTSSRLGRRSTKRSIWKSWGQWWSPRWTSWLAEEVAHSSRTLPPPTKPVSSRMVLGQCATLLVCVCLPSPPPPTAPTWTHVTTIWRGGWRGTRVWPTTTAATAWGAPLPRWPGPWIL